MIRTLIVDDEPLAREGIRLMLGGDSQVMEARNGRPGEIVSTLAYIPPTPLISFQTPQWSRETLPGSPDGHRTFFDGEVDTAVTERCQPSSPDVGAR